MAEAKSKLHERVLKLIGSEYASFHLMGGKYLSGRIVESGDGWLSILQTRLLINDDPPEEGNVENAAGNVAVGIQGGGARIRTTKIDGDPVLISEASIMLIEEDGKVSRDSDTIPPIDESLL